VENPSTCLNSVAQSCLERLRPCQASSSSAFTCLAFRYMGEDTFIYSQSPYSPPYRVKTEDNNNHGLMPYNNSTNSDPYCADPAKLTVMVSENSYHKDETMDEYHDARPHLHHMPSISTTCTSDSFQSPFPSAEGGEVSAFDLNASEAQDFEWTMNSAHTFQWPPNRTLPSPFPAICLN